MLKRALSQVLWEKDEGRSGEAKSELHTLCIRTGGINVSTEEDNQRGESKVSSPRGNKRAASEDLETEAPKQGKKTSPKDPAQKGVPTASCPLTGQPSTEL